MIILKKIKPLKFLHRADAGSGSSESKRLVETDRFVAIGMTLLTVFLHAVFLVKAGGFWRDEANSTYLALMPNLMDTWSALKFDSFPVFYVLTVRFWAYVFGSSDASLRAMGFSIGISIITVLWINARTLGNRVPLISLLLIGMSPVMIRSLDSIRPYGIAAITTILAFAVVWRAIHKPNAFHISMSVFALVLSVQTLYQSAFFVLAIGIAALSVSLLRGGFRHAALMAIPFCVAAISLLPYMDHLRETQNWSPLTKNPLIKNELMPAFLDAIRSPTQWFMWVWTAVLVLAVVGAIKDLVQKRSGEDGEQTRKYLLLYCGISFVLSLAGYVTFLVYVAGSISYQAWHFIPFLVPAAVFLEPFVLNAVKQSVWRAFCLLAVSAIAATILLPAARDLTMRMTSMDLVAAVIEREARSNDLVILNPWFYGVSFSRYYRGSAPWMTFPGLQETAWHRYDLIKDRMRQPETISEDIARVSATLQWGGRVWVVGELAMVNPAFPIKPLPPAPLPMTAWHSGPYLDNWSQHLMSTLAAHSLQSQTIPVHSDQRINPLESPQIGIAQGWVH